MAEVNDLSDVEGLFDWPFKIMSVGQVVEIDSSMANRGQSYAHQYGRKYGMKFKTKRRKSDGALFVKRVE